MKKLILPILYCLSMIACHPRESRVPTACANNLDFCLSSYDDNKNSWCQKKNYSSCSRYDWDTLCLQDLQVCESDW